MGSFKRALFGYRRGSVEVAIADRDSRIGELELEVSCLSVMVVERDREVGDLQGRLEEANQRYERGLVSLEAVSRRLEEIQTQARGQATRIRMKALSEAVEVGRRAQQLADGAADPAQNGNGGTVAASNLFEGLVKVEIGPLGDFSQLVGFEDAAGQIGATSEISVERFSEGRATLAMRLDRPVDLLHELEQHSPLEFKVRHTAGDSVVLDVDEGHGPRRQAA